MQAQHRARTLGDDLLVVGVDDERERGAVDADRRLDHVRDVALLVADPLELRARRLGVLPQVEVAAVRDALELLPADREEVLDVARRARVVRQLVGVVRADAQVRLAQAEVEVPVAAAASIQYAVPLVGLGGRDEELHLHLLELAHAEEEVPRRDLVAEALADLRDAERRLHAQRRRDVLEVDEDALRRLGPQVRACWLSSRTAPTYVSNIRLNSRGSVRSQSAVSPGCFDGRLPHALCSRWSARKRSLQVRQSTSGSEKPPTWPEATQTCGLQDDRRVERDHVLALLDHRALPLVLDVLLRAARRSGRSRTTSRGRRRCPTTGRRSRAGGRATRPSRSSPRPRTARVARSPPWLLNLAITAWRRPR